MRRVLFSPKTTYRIRGEEGERKKLSLGLTEHNFAFQTLWEALARVHSFNTHFLGPPISGSDHARPDTKMDEEKTRHALVSRSERRLRTARDKMQSRTWTAGERGGEGGDIRQGVGKKRRAPRHPTTRSRRRVYQRLHLQSVGGPEKPARHGDAP